MQPYTSCECHCKNHWVVCCHSRTASIHRSDTDDSTHNDTEYLHNCLEDTREGTLKVPGGHQPLAIKKFHIPWFSGPGWHWWRPRITKKLKVTLILYTSISRLSWCNSWITLEPFYCLQIFRTQHINTVVDYTTYWIQKYQCISNLQTVTLWTDTKLNIIFIKWIIIHLHTLQDQLISNSKTYSGPSFITIIIWIPCLKFKSIARQFAVSNELFKQHFLLGRITNAFIYHLFTAISRPSWSKAHTKHSINIYVNII